MELAGVAEGKQLASNTRRRVTGRTHRRPFTELERELATRGPPGSQGFVCLARSTIRSGR
jgi:hypothetical protein